MYLSHPPFPAPYAAVDLGYPHHHVQTHTWPSHVVDSPATTVTTTTATTSSDWPSHANRSTSWTDILNDDNSTLSPDIDNQYPSYSYPADTPCPMSASSSSSLVAPMLPLCDDQVVTPELFGQYTHTPATQPLVGTISGNGNGYNGASYLPQQQQQQQQQQHSPSQHPQQTPGPSWQLDTPQPNSQVFMMSSPITQTSSSPASTPTSFTTPSPTLSYCSVQGGVETPKRPAKPPLSASKLTKDKFVCPNCDKSFSRPYNLKSHMRTHTKERPFVCNHPGCTWKFVRPHDLKRHQLLHSGYKPHACRNCQRRFGRSDALKRHLRVDNICSQALAAHASQRYREKSRL